MISCAIQQPNKPCPFCHGDELADVSSHVLATKNDPLPLPLPPSCPQRHARDIDERRNRLSQEQLAARNQALHRTMQAS